MTGACSRQYRAATVAALEVLVCALVSAAVLLAVFLGVSTAHHNRLIAVEGLDLAGQDLGVRVGNGTYDNQTHPSSLLVSGLGRDGVAVVSSSPMHFEASENPILRYAVDSQQRPGTLLFYWRRAAEPQRVYFETLTPSSLHWSRHDLSPAPQWRGRIQEIGLLVRRPLAAPVRIKGVALESASALGSLQLILSQWATYEPVTHLTINQVGANDWHHSLPAAVAAAIWLCGAVFLYTLWTLLTRKSWRVSVVLGLLGLIWFTLDLRWQWQLLGHSADAYHRFANKSLQERQRASGEQSLYALADSLRMRFEEQSGRLFMLHDSDWKNFLRLRLGYLLLPLDIYNFGRYPLPNDVRPGDALLLIGTVPDLRYDSLQEQLVWPGGRLKVRPEYRDALVTLYRYVGP